jgi:hypothetical protein
VLILSTVSGYLWHFHGLSVGSIVGVLHFHKVFFAFLQLLAYISWLQFLQYSGSEFLQTEEVPN